MPRKRRPWSKTIEESGVSVRVYERAIRSLLYREVRRADGRKDRLSLGHRDRALAVDQARGLARRIAELRLIGQTTSVTFGQLVRLYVAHRAPQLSDDRRRLAVDMYAPRFLRHFGDETLIEDLSQTQIDGYVVARRAGGLKSEKHRGVLTKSRDGTIRNELNWLRSAIRWGRGYRVNGRPVLVGDVLAGVRLLQEKNPRRPVASEDRYARTLAKAAQADGSGRLACMLALARYTGRRVNATCQLRASDVLLTRDQLLRALATMGLDERQADYMPHGAIAWPSATDKLGFEELTAIAPACRMALERYLREHPKLGGAWLFRDLRQDHRGGPITRAAADYLLRRAEDLAGLPKLERGLWHAYRRLWAVERKHLPDVDVAKAGGWRDLATMKQSYQQPDPATVLRVVENEPPTGTTSSEQERRAGARAP
jgi:hypothetical protein